MSPIEIDGAVVVADVPPELVDQLVPIDELTPLRRNPRQGDVETIRGLLDKWGQYHPILVRRQTKEILKGNHTWQAARANGWTHIAVLYRDVETDAEAEALAIADNVASDKATWDIPLLSEVLQTEGMEVEATGFAPIDVQGILGQAENMAIAAGDSAATDQLKDPPTPEPPAKPTTRLGDRILLGDTGVLLCGDTTDPAALAQLLDGQLAQLTFTDPPYGVTYRDTGKGGERDKVRLRERGLVIARRFETLEGDELRADELVAFLADAFANVAAHSDPTAGLYTFHASRTAPLFEATLEHAGYLIRAQIIWRKARPAFNMAQYKYAHEPCYYAFRQGHAPAWHGDRSQTTVWEVAQDHGSDYQHPTQKPVRLAAQAIVNSSRPGGIVLDPFAGSGAFMLCAAQLGRRAYGAELDPGYCDVIVQRWQDLTGEKATRPSRRRGGRQPKETT